VAPIHISLVLWIVFILYWSAAASKTARTVSSESVRSRQLHQWLMYGALVLAFVRFWPLTGRVLPDAGIGVTSWIVAGLAVQSASFLLAVWARRHLGRNWSGAITAKESHALVRTGPYRRVRHPIYSAMIGMLLGTTLVSGEVHAFLALAILAIAYIRKIRLEERNLREVFGDEYEEYQRGSWAVIPGLI
jgi:protein-S-isoprenylcysteine O-methyltransferase Ste14